ncbi:MAG: bifunctional 2-polyprenyl-6-hydroxyphenol methylase/3-demethylubiquinol 3-O-methyltransferase UbiG, partial [Gammaproteobacteria bacterium]|nr:bifunctional 2-polyprenyl-6-hydroxyphenol methylase/3-demethylubiquinol 3-O-methyltransferase UbiG [Gammaproteobacteria bacterium]
RLDYIERRAGLAGQRVLDVGCGGGLLAEAMARRGATVTGIDMAAEALRVARAHAAAQEVAVTYERATPEEYATRHPEAFDVVVCLELLEHVPDPAAVVAACARLARPGGQVIFSTLNRNPKSYLLAIVGAEYLLDLIPRGTHDYARFIRPSELAGWARGAGLMTVDLTGLLYNPLTRTYRLGADVDVNYLAHCTKEA